MNYTKLTFSFRTKEAESSFFRNFTISLVVLLLFPIVLLAQEGNISVNIQNGTDKNFYETNRETDQIIHSYIEIMYSTFKVKLR